MEKVWEEASLVVSRRTSMGDTPSQSESERQQENSAPPPTAPPLRGRFGKLWERASSLGAGVVEKISTTESEKDGKNEEDAKKLPSPPPEPEELPPKRVVPPLPTTRTQTSIPPQLPPRNQNRVETTAPPTEEQMPYHDHSQPSPEQSTIPVQPFKPEKAELVVEKPRAPILPPRAPRHPPADVVRPGTPSAIPLPDSRPSTPIQAGAAERRISLPSTPTKLDHGRSSSPAPGAGGTPPPIPRRAAARVRPLSVSLHPPTPLDQPPIKPPQEEKEEAKGLNVGPLKTVDELTDPVERTAPPPAVEVVHKPTPGGIKPIFTKVEPRQPDAEVVQYVEASMAEGSGASPVDISHPIGDSSGLNSSRNLVGDRSWEDKTWREIVRLREEMFFARMGIVR